MSVVTTSSAAPGAMRPTLKTTKALDMPIVLSTVVVTYAAHRQGAQ